MKKLLVLCLATILTLVSLIGCSKKQTSYISIIDSGIAYPAPLNLNWGMTKGDVFKALGCKEEDSEKHTAPADEIVTVLSADKYATNVVVDSQKAAIVLHFANDKNNELCETDLGLIAADIYYPSESKAKVEAEFPASILRGVSILEAAEKANVWDKMSEFMEKTWRAPYTDPDTGNVSTIKNSEMDKVGAYPIEWKTFAKDKLVKVDNIVADGLTVFDETFYGRLSFNAPYAAYLNSIQ